MPKSIFAPGSGNKPGSNPFPGATPTKPKKGPGKRGPDQKPRKKRDPKFNKGGRPKKGAGQPDPPFTDEQLKALERLVKYLPVDAAQALVSLGSFSHVVPINLAAQLFWKTLVEMDELAEVLQLLKFPLAGQRLLFREQQLRADLENTARAILALKYTFQQRNPQREVKDPHRDIKRIRAQRSTLLPVPP